MKRNRTTSLVEDGTEVAAAAGLDPRVLGESDEKKKQRVDDIAVAVKRLLVCLGEDVTRQGIVDTPQRAAEAFMFWTKGYEQDLVRSPSVLETD
ncbi:hypothetical protein BASA81_015846 [Batrachochytrium salamandrivorans]|nr:hypothetical protein BASA81_015846 [Batrachochytrium salamandrivorans]